MTRTQPIPSRQDRLAALTMQASLAATVAARPRARTAEDQLDADVAAFANALGFALGQAGTPDTVAPAQPAAASTDVDADVAAYLAALGLRP